jgi:hypothetical protein
MLRLTLRWLIGSQVKDRTRFLHQTAYTVPMGVHSWPICSTHPTHFSSNGNPEMS